MYRSFLAAVAIVLASSVTGATQDKPVPSPPAAAPQQAFSGPKIPLKVQFVLSRYQGEKKVASLPYTVGVLSNGPKTSLRFGVQVPITTTVFGAAKEGGFANIPSASYSYKDMGTNIDCQASDAGAGQYLLNVTISDSSLHLDQTSAGNKQPQIVRDVPAFRSFNATFAMILRDGQTMQYASATDPISGEVMRIDVTMSLAK
jgi:hypothetical protein